jgi:hypothetical protein
MRANLPQETPYLQIAGHVTRDVRDQKNYTLPGPGLGPKEKIYRDQNRDQRLNPRLYDGLNSVNFCTSEVTLFEKKSRKVLVVD